MPNTATPIHPSDSARYRWTGDHTDDPSHDHISWAVTRATIVTRISITQNQIEKNSAGTNQPPIAPIVKTASGMMSLLRCTGGYDAARCVSSEVTDIRSQLS